MKEKLITVLCTLIIFSLVIPSGGTAARRDEIQGVSTITQVALPMVRRAFKYLPPIVEETTEVLPTETLQDLTAISEEGVLTFSETSITLEEVAPGDVIAGGISTEAPYGFLRAVTAITTQGDQVILETQPATIEDAIQQGTLNLSRQLTPADLETMTAMPGVTLLSTQGATLEDSFFFEIKDVVLYDHDQDLATEDDQIKANGSFELAPDIDFNAVYADNTLQDLVWSMTVDETTELEFVAEVELLNFELSYQVASLKMGAIVIWVGPLPAVLLIEMPIYLRLDGKVSVGITTSVIQEAHITAGLSYADGTWSPHADLANSFTYEPPRLSAGGSLKGYIDPPLGLLLYGIAGPFAAVKPYLSLEADIFADPWWELYGGLDATVGVRAELLGHSLGEHTETVIGYKILLAQAETQPPLPGERVLIPAGSFQMGCHADHNIGQPCETDELPLHTVNLSAYLIDQTEVTNLQYALCVADGACTPPTSYSSNTRTSYYDNPEYTDYPVIFVGWDQAQNYCTWAGGSLPTEAQWEQAARGSSEIRTFPWGDVPAECSLLNFNNCVGDTTAVGSYPAGASPYGLWDMAGNVYEWVSDWYSGTYYSESPVDNPTGPATGSLKIMRGGGYGSTAYFQRTAERGFGTVDYAHRAIGFRCAYLPDR